MIIFTIEAEPVAQGRPRFSTVHGQARAYDPIESRRYKQFVRTMAAQHAPEKPSTSPICLRLDVYRPIPKSFSNKKRTAAENGLIRPTTKPDGSNYLKLVEDALNGLMWVDDSQIVDDRVLKWYSERPRIVVTIIEITEAVS